MTETLTQLAEETEQSLSSLKAGQFEPIMSNPKWEEIAAVIKKQIDAYEESCVTASSDDSDDETALSLDESEISSESLDLPDELNLSGGDSDVNDSGTNKGDNVLDFEPINLGDQEPEVVPQIDMSDDDSKEEESAVELVQDINDIDDDGTVLELDVDEGEIGLDSMELEPIEKGEVAAKEEVSLDNDDESETDPEETNYDPENVQKIKSLLPDMVGDLLDEEKITDEKETEPEIAEEEEIELTANGETPEFEIEADISDDGSLVLDQGDGEELDEIRTIFCDEARSVLEQFDSAVSELNEEADIAPLLNAIMRNLHTLKGSARMAGLESFGDVAHQTEDFITNALTGSDSSESDYIKQARTILQEVHDSFLNAVQAVENGNDVVFESSLISHLSDELQSSITEQKQIADEKILEVSEILAKTELADLDSETQSVADNDNKVEVHEVDQELVDVFCEEGQEVLANINHTLAAWKSKQDWQKAKEAILRDLHTLKGSARMAGQAGIGNVAHALETLVEEAELKNAKQHNTFHKKVEEVHDLLLEDVQSLEAGRPTENHDALIQELEVFDLSGETKATKKKTKGKKRQQLRKLRKQFVKNQK